MLFLIKWQKIFAELVIDVSYLELNKEHSSLEKKLKNLSLADKKNISFEHKRRRTGIMTSHLQREIEL